MGLVDQHVKQVKVDAVNVMAEAAFDFAALSVLSFYEFKESNEFKKAINELGLTKEDFS